MRCKVGDLAIIVRSRTGLNFGRVVKVVAPYAGEIGPAGHKYSTHGLHSWIVEGRHYVAAVNGEVQGEYDWGVISDIALSPLRGDPDPTAAPQEVAAPTQDQTEALRGAMRTHVKERA